MDERRNWLVMIALVVICITMVFAGGCARKTGARKISTSRVVSLGEFAESSAPSDDEGAAAMEELLATSQESDEPNAELNQAPISKSEVEGETEAGEADTIVTNAPPPPRRKKDLKPGDGVIVDSLIGQVNGRPIFADEFFRPIEDELIAQSRQMTQSQFMQHARAVVEQRLDEVVMNELFLAEAEAGLSQEEQRGLFAFMKMFQEETIAESGGLEGLTRAELELEDITLEQYIEAERNRRLIQKLIFEKIRPRVIVSWRDIEREYERRRDEFNPPAEVTLSRIRLSTERDAAQIADVQTRLDAGETFADVAASLGLENGGKWQTFRTGPGGIDAIELNEDIKKHLIGLKQGDTTQPFQVGETNPSTWWLHVTEVKQPPARDIYDPDVQRSLNDYLYNVRFNEQFMHYRQTLFQRGIFDELDDMRDRLLAIAIVRYGP